MEFEVNKTAKEKRIQEEFERLRGEIEHLTKIGYDEFRLGINGEHNECQEVCNRLGLLGVKIRERGYEHRGFGPDGHANVIFYL